MFVGPVDSGNYRYVHGKIVSDLQIHPHANPEAGWVKR